MDRKKMSSGELAQRVRKDVIQMTHKSHASHVASALSVADIIAVLYADVLNVFPDDPQREDRDRLILSKGHAGAAIYAVLAELGFFPREELEKYYTDGSVYSGHVSHRGVPGVEFSTGSLGHGAAVACGMAMAAKCGKRPYNVYTVIGDGECNEGSIWEMAMTASQYKLDNFTVVIDRNGMQAMGFCEELLQMEPMAEKWRDFGWTVAEVADGNDHDQLRGAFHAPFHGKPKCIVARTVKGKGVSFMENNLLWHYKDPQGDFYERAIREITDEKL